MTNKEQLKQLARDIKFESVIFADEFKFSKKEDLRYYLWLCELNKWLGDNFGIYSTEINLNTDWIELRLILFIEELKRQRK